jgi:hypothetical protein
MRGDGNGDAEDWRNLARIDLAGQQDCPQPLLQGEHRRFARALDERQDSLRNRGFVR